MPGGDGTGPGGMGPMTGRAAGYCAGYPVPGFINPIPGRAVGGWYGAPYGGAPYGAMPYGLYPGSFGYAGMGAYGAWPRFVRGFGRGRGWAVGFGGGRGRGRGFRPYGPW